MKNTKIKTLLLVHLVSLMGFQVFVPIYALFASDVGASPAQTSLIWSYYSLVMAIAIFVMGKLENGYDKEKILIIGYFLYAVGSYAFLLAHNLWSLIIILSFNALVGGMVFPAYKTVFGKNQDRGRESEEWAWFDSSTMLASAIGAGLGGIMIGLFGFIGLFLTMGTVQLIAAIIAWRFLPRVR